MKDLTIIRDEINQINEKMLELFIRRMELSSQVFSYKKENNLPVLDRKREEEILQKVADNSPHELRSYSLEFFRSLMDLSKDYQENLK